MTRIQDGVPNRTPAVDRRGGARFSPRWPRIGETSAMAALGMFSAGVLFLLAHRALGDDSYITLSYARNLAFHGHWGLTEFRTSNSATSPLNVGALAALTYATRAPVVAAGLLLVASGGLIGAWSTRIARSVGASRLLPIAAIGVLFTSPLLVSTIGLELYLGAALMIGIVRHAIAGRAVATGILAGLLVLTRPDLVVVALVVLIGIPAVRRRFVVASGVLVLVAAPWHVVSWFALGSAVPDTFVFKTAANHFWGSEATLLTAPVTLYGAAMTSQTILTAIPVLIGVVCLVGCLAASFREARAGWARAAAVFGVAGIAHWLALVAVGAAPYPWYYAPMVIGLTMTTAVTIGALHERGGGRVRTAVGATAVFATVAVTLTTYLTGAIPWRTSPMHTNWASQRQYAEAGRQLRVPPGATVASPGEIGTLAYFCRCDIVDLFSDRGVAKSYIAEREREAGPVMGALLQINYRNLPDAVPARIDYHLRIRQTTDDSLRSWPLSTPLHGETNLVLER